MNKKSNKIDGSLKYTYNDEAVTSLKRKWVKVYFQYPLLEDTNPNDHKNDEGKISAIEYTHSLSLHKRERYG